MNEKATQKSEEVNLPKPKTASKTLMLSCGVGIRGAALLPAKMLGIIDWYFNNLDPNAGVMGIVIREDDHPKGFVALSFPWTASYVINVQHLFNRVCAKLKKEPRLNLAAACWLHLLEAILHETVHVGMAFADPAEHEEYLTAKDDELEEAMELTVKEIARDKMFDLAKAVDIEPPPLAEMGMLGALIHAKFIKDQDTKMVKKSTSMLEEGLVYSDLKKDEEDYTIHRTLRSFIRHALAPVDDTGWEDEPNLIKVSFALETGETVEHISQPVQTAEAMTADQQVATAEATTVEAQAPAGGQPVFVGAGEETENIDMPADQAAVAAMFTPSGDVENNGTIPMSQQATAEAVQPAATTAAQPEVYDKFELPQPVQQAQAQAVANMAAPTQPMAGTPLPQLNLTGEVIQACMRDIYMRLYATMFRRCGWAHNPQTGRFAFTTTGEVTKSIEIKDIIDRYGAQGLIAEYRAPNENNQDTDYACDGYVRGFVFNNKGVPAFQLALNIGGQRVIRRLVAQNPNKIVNNAYSKGAEQAGVGNAIAYIFSMADNSRPWHERCPAKIVNNDYQMQSAS